MVHALPGFEESVEYTLPGNREAFHRELCRIGLAMDTYLRNGPKIDDDNYWRMREEQDGVDAALQEARSFFVGWHRLAKAAMSITGLARLLISEMDGTLTDEAEWIMSPKQEVDITARYLKGRGLLKQMNLRPLPSYSPALERITGAGVYGENYLRGCI